MSDRPEPFTLRVPDEATFTDIRRWSAMPRGGHFAAMEQPEDLAREVREFFRPLRGSRPTGPAAAESGGGDP